MERILATRGSPSDTAPLSGQVFTIDLRRSDLRFVNLNGAILTGVNFEGADLTGARLRNADLSSAMFQNAVLRGADFTHANLRRADLSNADMSNAKMNYASAQNAIFIESVMYNVSAHEINLTGATISYSCLVGIRLSGALLDGARIANSNLRYSNLEGIDLTNMDLHDSNIVGANITGNGNLFPLKQRVDPNEIVYSLTPDPDVIRGSIVTNVTTFSNSVPRIVLNIISRASEVRPFAGANLTNIHFVYVDMNNVNLEGANLAGAIFRNVSLIGVNFIGTNLRGASFTNCNLDSASFYKADLTGASFYRCNIKDTDFSFADMVLCVIDTTCSFFRPDLTATNLSNASIDTPVMATSLVSANIVGTIFHREIMATATSPLSSVLFHQYRDGTIDAPHRRPAMDYDEYIGMPEDDHWGQTSQSMQIGQLRQLREVQRRESQRRESQVGVTLATPRERAGNEASQGDHGDHGDHGDQEDQDQEDQEAQPPEPIPVQSAQQYEIRRISAMQQTAELHDKCSSDFSVADRERIASIPGMPNLIAKVEIQCRHQMMTSQAGHFTLWFQDTYRNIGQGDIITIRSDENSKYYFNILAGFPLNEQPLMFKLVDKSGRQLAGADYGGITRDIFSRAGKYITRQMKRDGTDRLYFKDVHSESFGTRLAHVVRLSILQGVKLGAPLSYGIIYMMQNGLRGIDDIKLETLMYLYKMDNHHEFMMALGYITDESLPYLDDMPVQGAAREGKGLSSEERYYWLKRYLYEKLFGRSQRALKAFLVPMPNDGNLRLIQLYIKTAGLSEIAMALGLPVTKEDLIKQLETAQCTNEQNRSYLIRYINESSLEVAQKFLIFVTGSSDTSRRLTINSQALGAKQVPVAHTCFSILELSQYQNYDDFKAAMDVAIAHFNTFQLA